MRQIIRKQACNDGRRVVRLGGVAGGAAVLLATLLIPACRTAITGGTLRPQDLCQAEQRIPTSVQKAVCDERIVELDGYRPLSPRVGLLVIRSRHAWNQLARYAPDLVPPEDFHHRTVVVLVSRAGIPLSGRWPIRLVSLRAVRGIGYASIHFAAGNYLPDGTTYVEAVTFDDLRAIAMADVNGSRYYPQTLTGSR